MVVTVSASTTPGDHPPRFPLSFAQQRLWFLDHFNDAALAYNIAGAIRLRGPLDERALELAVGEIVARHDVLRTTFPTLDGRPCQVVAAEALVAFPVVDVNDVPEDGRVAAAISRADAFTLERFDLTNGPLFRVLLLRLGPEDRILALSMHHIVSDGWSLEVLARELSALYAAFLVGAPSPLGPLPIQYVDYALWQRQLIETPRFVGHIDYWRKQLGGAPALKLPTDQPRPEHRTGAGAAHRLALSKELTYALRALGRSHRGTLFMVLCAALQALLARYSGQTDIVIGSPVAGRDRPETEPLMGLFLNMLTLRTDLAGDPTFSVLLSRVRETTLAAYRHQQMPFERIVEELRPARELGRNPFFQVMLTVHHRSALAELRLPDVDVEFLPLPTRTAKFDLALDLIARENGVQGTLEYSTEVFTATTAERMISQLEQLLAGVAASPDRQLSRMPLLSDSARRMLLGPWNPPFGRQPSSEPVDVRFARRALGDPGSTAVIAGDEMVTAEQLELRANRLAHRLRASGVGRNTVVGILLDRGIDLVVALLATMKAGGAYLLLNPTYPPDRNAYMLTDSAAAVLVVGSASKAYELPMPSHECLAMDEPGLEQDPSAALCSAGLPDDLAYVTYTCGSMGRPIGVQIEQRSLVSSLRAFEAKLELGPHDAFLATTTVAFDKAALELLLPLVTGARLVTGPCERELDGTAVADIVARHSITALQASVWRWGAWLDSGWVPAAPFRALIWGEALSSDMARRLCSQDAEVWSLYGPAEVAGWSMAARWDAHGQGPLGRRPLDDSRIYIRDDVGELAPLGVPGEIYISGQSVARGYVGQPELSAERFVRDPHPGRSDARMYRTGDLGRIRPDGDIDVLGRRDEQLLIRGFRVEPAEIERVLCVHPGVIGCAVLLCGHGHEQHLIAHFTSSGEPPAEPDLLMFARRALPEYMVPTEFRRIAAIPFTADGAVDRSALRERVTSGHQPADAGAQGARPAIRVADATEMRLLAVWCDVLGIDDCDMTDSFFDLGGHSLLAMILLSEVHEAFGLRVPFAEFLAAPTIANLAITIRGQVAGPDLPSPVVRLCGSGDQQPFFCVHPGGAEVFLMAQLRRALDNRPLYGLLSIGLDGEAQPLASIEAMASRYVSEIEPLTRNSPLLLGGYSVGGLVAYEMARQLVHAGAHPPLVVMFETPLPGGDTRCHPLVAQEGGLTLHDILLFDGLHNLDNELESIRELKAQLGSRRAASHDELGALLNDLGHRMGVVLAEMKTKGLAIRDLDVRAFHRAREIWALYLWAGSVYRPTGYPGRIVIFKGTDTVDIPIENDWRRYAADVRVHQVDTWHGALFGHPEVGDALVREFADAEGMTP